MFFLGSTFSSASYPIFVLSNKCFIKPRMLKKIYSNNAETSMSDLVEVFSNSSSPSALRLTSTLGRGFFIPPLRPETRATHNMSQLRCGIQTPVGTGNQRKLPHPAS